MIITILQACSPDGIGCFTPAGEQKTVAIELGFYDEIDVSDNIKLSLNSSDPGQIIVTAGSNEITGIKTEVRDSVLFISNENSCNWSRKYGDITVSMPYENLDRIVLRGSGVVYSEDTIVKNKLDLISIEGSGDFNLALDVDDLYVSSNEVANFYLSGQADQLSVGFYFSEGIFYGQELRARNCQVVHRGTNTMHLNISGMLSGTLDSFGDIMLYEQMPDSINVELNSRGRVIYNF